VAQDQLRLHAAGSLRAPLTEAVAAFRAAGGPEVQATFGPSGLLAQRITAGEASDVFASANMAHPLAVARPRGLPVAMFARNRLCALARPGVDVTTQTLLERMLDPGIRLGTSTPRADPSGDYAWAAFARAEAVRPGARAALEAKALQLVGGPTSPEPPAGLSAYGWLMREGRADLFLGYCTNAAIAAAEVPGARVVQLPDALAVGAEYGLVVPGERPAAARLGLFLLSPEGQAILARHGFDAPTAPREPLP
jgi:ABC-type molybdate transport system substrate-binding protein